MLNKDVTHAKMRRIENPKVLVLDCPLEYKKGESQTSIEVKNADDWNLVLKEEEEAVKRMCQDIIKLKVDVVVTEKGLSDLAQHYFVKAGITAFRRLRNRLESTGACVRCNDLSSYRRSERKRCGHALWFDVGAQAWRRVFRVFREMRGTARLYVVVARRVERRAQ